MAKSSELSDETFKIEEQIIIGGLSSKIRKIAVRGPYYSLKDMLIDRRRDENSLRKKRRKQHTVSQRSKVNYHRKFSAKEKACRNCDSNHCAVVCRSSKPLKPNKTVSKRQEFNGIRPF